MGKMTVEEVRKIREEKSLEWIGLSLEQINEIIKIESNNVQQQIMELKLEKSKKRNSETGINACDMGNGFN